MTQEIKNKVVVITGASSGNGAATARGPAEHGASSCWVRGDSTGSRRWRESCSRWARRPLPDVTLHTQVVHLVDHTVRTHGRIDVILNNADIMPHSPLERRKVEDWEHTIDVNQKGTLYGICAALPHMMAQNSDHIINASSVAGHKVRPGTPPVPRPHGIHEAGVRGVEAPGDRHGGGGSRECRGQAPCSLSGSDSW